MEVDGEAPSAPSLAFCPLDDSIPERDKFNIIGVLSDPAKQFTTSGLGSLSICRTNSELQSP
jgi:hypothetical protein